MNTSQKRITYLVICKITKTMPIHHGCDSREYTRILIETLQWRYNGHDCASNHRRLHCLLNCWFRRMSKKTSKLRVKGPVMRQFFHLMTSSWTIPFVSLIVRLYEIPIIFRGFPRNDLQTFESIRNWRPSERTETIFLHFFDRGGARSIAKCFLWGKSRPNNPLSPLSDTRIGLNETFVDVIVS